MPQGCENISQALFRNIILGWHQHKSSPKEQVNPELKAVEETRAQGCGSFTQTSHNIHSELKKACPWAKDTAAHKVYLSKVKECEKGRMFISSLKGLGLPSNMPKLTLSEVCELGRGCSSEPNNTYLLTFIYHLLSPSSILRRKDEICIVTHTILFKSHLTFTKHLLSADFPVIQEVKNLPVSAGHLGSIPGLGRSPGEGNGDPLQYFCLENSMEFLPGE